MKIIPNKVCKHLVPMIACLHLMTAAQSAPLKFAANERLAEQWVAHRMLQGIYAKVGIAIHIEPMPPARANLETIKGLRDGEVARIKAYGERNPTLIRVATPYYYLTTVAYSMKARMASVTQLSDLRHYTIGALRGVAHSQEATEGHPSVTFAQTSEQMFRMLASGRFDVALDTGINGRYLLKRQRSNEIESSKDLAQLELFHYLHPRHAELATKLDLVIRQMQASGELEALRQKAEQALQEISIDGFSGPQP